VKVISFDLDGTIADSSFADAFWEEEVPALYARKNQLSIDEAWRIVKRSYEEVGSEDIRWYQPEYWFNLFDLDEDVTEVLRRVKDRVNLFPDALEVIEALYQKYDLIIISNAPREFIEIELEGIEDYFSASFSCTSDFGVVKKSGDAYLRVCSKIGVAPGDVLHLGDNPIFDYEVPRSIGMRALLIDRTNDHGGSGLKDMREILRMEPFSKDLKVKR